MDISPTTISRFLYGPTTGHSWSSNTSEFDHPWDIVRSGDFQRNTEQREAVILWLARYIAADGERAEWVAALRLGIRKATLNFVAKFFWLLVGNRVSPTKADNQVTWDRAVMVAALVAGVEIDFARMLLAEIHGRAFRTSTTYPFPCLIFHLCRDSGVPIWHCDRLVHPTGHWTSALFGMTRMWQHLAESPKLRYPSWVPILQTQWGRHRAVTPLSQITPTLS